jgi:predicted DCC family thiol-disulfide oxidoreductase YuxK
VDRAVLLYDDDCGFCRWSTAKLLAWDRHGHVRAVALRSAEADLLFTRMDPARKIGSWHLVSRDGTVRSGGAAVGTLARLLPGGTPLALLAEALPGLTERAYRWTAEHRDGLGRLLGERACSVDPRASAAGR